MLLICGSRLQLCETLVLKRPQTGCKHTVDAEDRPQTRHAALLPSVLKRHQTCCKRTIDADLCMDLLHVHCWCWPAQEHASRATHGSQLPSASGSGSG